MNTSSSNAEASVEFAIDNAMERILSLKDSDRKALCSEYKEWLSGSKKDLEVLVIDYLGNNH